MNRTTLLTEFPFDVAKELVELAPSAKALLLNELTDEVAEKIDGFEVPNLSSTSTQWLKSLTVEKSLAIIKDLADQLLLEVTK
ncbi:MAG: hypothetical protein ACK5BG_12705 [Pseudanabaena sp.]|jgi:hypothetical protein